MGEKIRPERFTWDAGSIEIIEDEVAKGGVFKIAKTNDDEMLAFGWANVAIRKNGEQIEDWQKDMVDPDELEKAVYHYVEFYREGGEMHERGGSAVMVESVMFTKQKMEAMGIPEGTVPEGWWIGFKVYDPDVWDNVKKGRYKMFSIEGEALRQPVEKNRPTARTFADMIEKYNPHHDELGRFSTADGGIMYVHPKDPNLRAKLQAKETQRTGGQDAADKFADSQKPAPKPAPKPKKPPKPKVDPNFPNYKAAKDVIGKVGLADISRPDGGGIPRNLGPAINQIVRNNTNSDGTTKPMAERWAKQQVDILHTDDVNKYKNGGYKNSTEDVLLTMIYKTQGFHAKPKLLPADEFDKLKAATKVKSRIINRMVGSQNSVDAFKNSDDHYVGSGIYGHGTYTGPAHTWNLKNYQARSYGSEVIEMIVHPKAKIAKDWDALTTEHKKFLDDPNISAATKVLYGTTSRYAAGKGYDGYVVPRGQNSSSRTSDYIVLLNRGAVVVKE